MDFSSSRILAQGVFVLLVLSSVAEGTEPRTILVGDSEGWRAGTNYTQWAIQNSPFHINDTLVFKYPPPGNSTVTQSVYLLPDLWSYITCEFRGAKVLGNASEGRDEGFKVALTELKSYYFASAEGNSYDCLAGLTKFTAVPSS
ncbi:hypothetical protein PHAVU_009G062600 [Phaseolus vulgaris]|uniref:Phytocyanin domain-containing protein n=1 Tax=Phaseolus vulgaris TaxID=3885 RepID=V7AVM7_PHAVU|nr:hypothetical protein PHAVU_009G062600g [Phaseolus vulgaris]ESW08648.1 hypothetical protein PHAVU_009G062600g [Phaseolus vulgaris]